MNTHTADIVEICGAIDNALSKLKPRKDIDHEREKQKDRAKRKYRSRLAGEK